MKCLSTPAAAVVVSTLLFAGCQQDSRSKVLKELPDSGSLSYNHVVYVENDGRCDTGQVMKVTGGKKSRGIARKHECVSRPH